MTFLVPSLLALGLAIAVPLVLHILQRHQGPRVVFPALRYLRRAEREHATRIRLRQLLLLALRVLVILLLAAAAARPFLHGAGQGHPPTSVVLILDNSLSSGMITGDRRVLDDLRDAALETLAAAGPGDRFWLIRAGAPWDPALADDPARLADVIRRTEPMGGAADLAGEVERAASILAGEPEGRPREIQVFSDLQRSTFRPLAPAGGETPVVRVFVPSGEAPANRAVTGVEVGGGLPPRADQRSTVAITVRGSGPPAGQDEADSVAVRLVLEGSVRAAGRGAVGSVVVLPFPARPAGGVTGYAEIDPDALLADDRRYFATDVSPPTGVAVAESRPFVDEAIAVLEEDGRVRQEPLERAAVVIAPDALGADRVRRGADIVVLAPASSLAMGAANQRLAAAGIPWRFRPPGTGEARLDTAGTGFGASLSEIRLRQVYGLEPEGATDSVLLRLRTGEPWAVTGSVPAGGRYVILASPLTLEGGTIPASAAMVPLLDRAIAAWATGAQAGRVHQPGDVVTLPGDRLVGPDGERAVTRGSIHRLLEPGIYRVLQGRDTVASYAVNAPPEESLLERLSEDEVATRLAGRDVRVAGGEQWRDAIFHERLGREIDRWVLAAVLLVLLVEMLIAATGRSRSRTPARSDAGPSSARGREGDSVAGSRV